MNSFRIPAGISLSIFMNRNSVPEMRPNPIIVHAFLNIRALLYAVLPCLLLCSMFILPAGPAHAQGNRLLPANDSAYEYIVRLQRRGHLLDLNPTSLPYRRGEVWDALIQIDTTLLGNNSERHWVNLLRRKLQPTATSEGQVAVGYSLIAGADIINSDRIDTVRPRGDALNFYWHGSFASGYLEAGPVAAEMSLFHSRYYDRDPDGIDTALRLMARSEHSYVGWNHRWVSAYMGRWDLHWGTYGDASTIISSNARSRDQIFLRIGNNRVSVTATLSELDSATDGRYYTGRAADDSVRFGSIRRFHAAHRWDYRPTRKFMISFMESAIYSGPSSSLSLKYLNPVNPFTFVVDNTPKNDDNNGFLSGLLWVQFKRLTLQGQFMVDDIRLQPNAGPETITFALTGSATYALPKADLKLSLETVTARAYNAPQTEGQYIYLNRGLATQFSDYIHTSLSLEFYMDHRAPGLRFGPKMDMLLQGERDMRQPFPINSESIHNLLDGDVERIVRGSITLTYQPMHWWWITVDGGYNVNRDDQNRFIGLINTGIMLTLDKALKLWDS